MSLSYDYNILPSQELRSYWLCSQQHATTVPTGLYHQRHTHLPAPTALPHPSLAISAAPCLQRTQCSHALGSPSTTERRDRSFVPFTASPRTSQGLLQPKTLMKPEFPSETNMSAVAPERRHSAQSAPSSPEPPHDGPTSSVKKTEGRTQHPPHLADILRQEEECTEGEGIPGAPPHTERPKQGKRGLRESDGEPYKVKQTRPRDLLHHGHSLRKPAPSLATVSREGVVSFATGGPGVGFEFGVRPERFPCPASASRSLWGRPLHVDRLERSLNHCQRRMPGVEWGSTDYQGCHVYNGFHSVQANGPGSYQAFHGYYGTLGGVDPNTIYRIPSFPQDRLVQQSYTSPASTRLYL